MCYVVDTLKQDKKQDKPKFGLDTEAGDNIHTPIGYEKAYYSHIMFSVDSRQGLPS